MCIQLASSLISEFSLGVFQTGLTHGAYAWAVTCSAAGVSPLLALFLRLPLVLWPLLLVVLMPLRVLPELLALLVVVVLWGV